MFRGKELDLDSFCGCLSASLVLVGVQLQYMDSNFFLFCLSQRFDSCHHGAKEYIHDESLTCHYAPTARLGHGSVKVYGNDGGS